MLEGGPPLRIVVAAIQMPSELHGLSANLARADEGLRQAHEAGAEIAVLPEMFNTGYGHCPDYGPFGEGVDGPTLTLLRRRSKQWGMGIAAGFVERAGRHLYDALAFVNPEGDVHVYRKRNLVFWERSRFNPGREPMIVETRWGRIGLAICADMIYRQVWNGYRDRIDLAIIAAAWPDFACRLTGRKHWLLGRVGPLAGEIPGRVARDLGIPVVFANQCGETSTTVPLLGSRIADRFAGWSTICDGRHGFPVHAGVGAEVLPAPITIHSQRGIKSWRSTSLSVPAA